MIRAGLLCFALCLGIVALASILEQTHAVVFGPCAGPGAIAIYGALFLTALTGIVLTLIGMIVWLAQKLRTVHGSN
jgi:hypothetical protein